MKGKVALITGASRGLGRSAALQLAAQGVDIIGTFHSKAAEAQAVADEIERLGARALMLQLDVGDSAGFAGFAGFADRLRAALLERFDRQSLDFLINNAGIGQTASFADTREEQFDLLMNIH
ncbi:Short-chain dehydrogenase/reductase SDR [Stutzerimonas stutzeri]|nr:Short-chain dehydrogenase/reductase SDR [Stutzerimonas stutzeri]